ncbi:MAG: helix-turn-helix transcriptional regulator, partial [Clostridiales bacterium]|nr:helix-turn-helix transcriptional regulator [Clostridiales bacterium]
YLCSGSNTPESLIKPFDKAPDMPADISLFKFLNGSPEEPSDNSYSPLPSYHHSFSKDARLFEAMRNGDRKGFYTILNSPGDGPEGVLCRNDATRSYKNLFIVTVAHLTRSAIEGGADSEIAYTLSDSFIQKVEEIKLYEDITELFLSMFEAFLSLVQKALHHKYTGPVYQTVEYINRHYPEKLLISDLADRVHMSASHLLRLFREQTGMNIKTFILQKRIHEVKSLLAGTNHDMATICEMTGFCDQSHMAGHFKRIVHTTPKKFRNDKGTGG